MPSTLLRLSVELGSDHVLDNGFGAAAVLSPDGKVLAFIAIGNPRTQLYVRPLDQLNAIPLSGTDGARNPFFSPDGHWIAFFADGKLKKIYATGGAAVTLCDAPDDRGGSWGEDGSIVFAPATNSTLFRVSSGGGTPEMLTKFDSKDGELSHRWPQVLRGGRVLLYTASPAAGVFDYSSIVALSVATGERKVLQRGGYYGRYLPTDHVTYMRESTLFAIPFDPDRMEVRGQPVPVIEGVSTVTGNGGTQFAFSNSGTAVYLPGSDVANVSMYWMDREGKTTPLRLLIASYLNPRFSPDGRRLAVQIQGDIWVYDWNRDTISRLTLDPAFDSYPVWTPDGQHIAFASTRNRDGSQIMYWQRADGSADVQRLTESRRFQIPRSWHPNGKFLAFEENQTATGPDIMILPVDGDEKSGWKPGTPYVFWSSPFVDTNPAFSPDGRWIAYQSSKSGTFEVYVRPFPGSEREWQISNGGGGFPFSSRTKNELFYKTSNQKIMVVDYTVAGNSFSAKQPQLLSETQATARGTNYNYDLHPDGRRFAILRIPEGQSSGRNDKIVFISNFFDELRRVAPPTK